MERTLLVITAIEIHLCERAHKRTGVRACMYTVGDSCTSAVHNLKHERRHFRGCTAQHNIERYMLAYHGALG